jgi:hypothetical protein
MMSAPLCVRSAMAAPQMHSSLRLLFTICKGRGHIFASHQNFDSICGTLHAIFYHQAL